MKVVATILLGPGTADVVGDAIHSAAPYADEFALIWSGEHEDLEAATASVEHEEKRHLVRKFDWTGSYADARNEALAQAALMGADWAMTVDTDERFDLLGDPEKLRQVLEKTDATVVEAQCRDEGYWKERFIRVDTPGLEWRGRSCEVLERDGKTARIADSKFWELPKSPEALRARQERGVANMPDEIENDPENPRWRRHYASCLKGLGQHQASVGAARVAIDLFARRDSREPEGWTRYMMCESLCALEQYEEAATEAAIGLGRHAGMLPEFGSVLAYCEWKRETAPSVQNASRWAQLALITPPDKTRSFFRSDVCKQNAYRVLYAIHPELAEQGKEKRFDSDAYAKREAFREDYAILARALMSEVDLGNAVLDMGAGQGLLLSALYAVGYLGELRGVELEESAREHASALAKDVVKFGCSLLDWEPPFRGTVFSLEVLEHMPESDADRAVEALCEWSNGTVVFSAAQPGQGGHGHVNEQPKDYWRRMFQGNGFTEDRVVTDNVVNCCRDMRTCHWLPKNMMVFRRM